MPDYNGNGNTTEGISVEISGLKAKLYSAIQAYAKTVALKEIVYSEASYPYWFIDTNANGTADTAEIVGTNGFASWTARLVKAAYNFQFVTKDPGAYAHNAKYVIQLMTDSIADLNSKLSTPISMTGTARVDVGHFDDTKEAWRHWDADGAVSASCARCHSAEGLPFKLGLRRRRRPADFRGSGLHPPATTRKTASSCAPPPRSPSPSGLVVKEGDNASNLCMNCHQGRQSTVSVNTTLGTKPEDTVDATLKFINVHYMAAGATFYGTQAKGGYEYATKAYPSAFTHAAGYTQCGSCHSAHGLEVKVGECATCHTNVSSAEDLKNIRFARSGETDYDGNSDTTEGISVEIDHLMVKLLAAIRSYAHNVAAKGHRLRHELRHRHQRRRHSEHGRNHRLQRLDSALAQSRLQLPIHHQRPRRLRP